MSMSVPDLLTQPFTIILIAVIAFFGKDIISQVKVGVNNKVEIERLQQRVMALETSQLQTTALALNIVKLEEQVKNLAENIKYLLNTIRKDKSDG